jgi:dihydroxyacetone kinase-like predicted kinase
MVAVIDGEGLREMLRSLGAVVVDTTSDPMDRAILAAIEVVASNSVVVLINGYPILPSAERAASRSTKAVRIISTSSIPSELSAAAAFNPFLSMEENTKVMEDVSVACRSGAVARDERNEETAKAPGERAWIGLVDAETVSIGDRADLVAVEVTRRLAGERSEVISLVVGHDAARDRALVEQAMRDAFVGLDLQVIDGGQPGPPFVIGVE